MSEQEPAPTSQNSTMPSLKINPQRAAELIENISSIRSRIQTILESNKTVPRSSPPRIVAVSKLKPATDILALHRPPSLSQHQDFTPQDHFGENYVQELLEKSRVLPRTIRWHFIGGLQSNKCTQLARDVRGLWAVESVDSAKKARALDKGWKERKEGKLNGKVAVNGEKHTYEGEKEEEEQHEEECLRVFVQVNTSGEESKSGVQPKSDELAALCSLIRDECKYLRLQGLMTIGAIARSQETTAETENEDFDSLRENRDWLVKEHGFDERGLELSMGMSEDFEGAIVQGSDEVRIGSTIFGARPPRKEAKVLENSEDANS